MLEGRLKEILVIIDKSISARFGFITCSSSVVVTSVVDVISVIVSEFAVIMLVIYTSTPDTLLLNSL